MHTLIGQFWGPITGLQKQGQKPYNELIDLKRSVFTGKPHLFFAKLTLLLLSKHNYNVLIRDFT